MPDVDMNPDLSNIAEDENQALKTFEVLFRTLFEPLCRSVNKMVRDAALSEDIVQDVFLKAWNNRSKLDFSQSVKSYLYKAAFNTAINQLETRKNKYSLDDLPLEVNRIEGASVDQQVQFKEVQLVLEQTLDLLPPKCKAVFILIKYEEMSYLEVADHLGISVKTVENQMGKALKHMRDHMQEYLGYLLMSIWAFKNTML
ncbi:MAG: RNA polymerase sigma-70 factor [Bacteroidota bacterium]|nr:RNA polymerase sigma-70 factor [Bacteroidota bacterium]